MTNLYLLRALFNKYQWSSKQIHKNCSLLLGWDPYSLLKPDPHVCRSFSRGPLEVGTLVRMLQLGATRRTSSRSCGLAYNLAEQSVATIHIPSDETHLCLGCDIACFVISIQNKLLMPYTG